MVWNSVVGKLWITIIGLVAVVLTLLSLLLVQFLDRYYYQERADNLKQLAIEMATIIEESPDVEHVNTARELMQAYSTNLIVQGVDDVLPAGDEQNSLPYVQPQLLTENEQLKKALDGEISLIRDRFPVSVPGSADQMMDILAVAVPLLTHNGEKGSIILYQTLEQLAETTKETTKYILYAAAIGIFLATIFAFFLSTRVTHPLRQMKKAADSFSRGEFSSQIPIRQNDEIGDLASTFNHMAKQLDDLIHALSQEKEHLESVLRSMVDGVITVDTEGRIINFNPPAEQMLKALNYELTDGARDGGDEPAVGKMSPEPLFSFSRTVMEEAHESETDIIAQGRIWSVIMAPLYDRNQVRGAVAVLRNMTKERQLDKLRKDFIANVSHELRTPLAMLQGYSEAIVDDIAADPEETKELAQIIYDESVRMSRLVNDLLDLGRMESGHIELNIEDVELIPMVERMVRKFHVVGKERGIMVMAETEVTPRDHFPLDMDKMEQVFTNLIDNALRHTQPGGRVTAYIGLREQGLFIDIRDTGSGIPEEDLPFVFERFYKADKARTRGRSGTGLGLAIVKQIVLAHGGKITVHSKLGEGTTFSIHIPNDPAILT